jgi:hypothetical protein
MHSLLSVVLLLILQSSPTTAPQTGKGSNDTDWMVYVAVATLFVLIWQTYETRRAVNIAHETLVSTLRPRVILRRVSLRPGTNISTQGAPDRHKWEVDFVAANTGGTTARISTRSFIVKMFDDAELPVFLPYGPEDSERFSLEPGEERGFSVGLESELIALFRQLGVRGGYLNRQRTAHVYFFGYVHYEDDRGTVRKMAVLRHYDTEAGRFRVVGDPDYEYAD